MDKEVLALLVVIVECFKVATVVSVVGLADVGLQLNYTPPPDPA